MGLEPDYDYEEVGEDCELAQLPQRGGWVTRTDGGNRRTARACDIGAKSPAFKATRSKRVLVRDVE